MSSPCSRASILVFLLTTAPLASVGPSCPSVLVAKNVMEPRVSTWSRSGLLAWVSFFNIHFYLTLILLWCIRQPCGYNVTGQLQELKDLKSSDGFGRIYYTVFATSSVVTHFTLNHGFPFIWVSWPGGCVDPTESLAERQIRSPHGWAAHRFEPGTSRMEVTQQPKVEVF